MQRHCIAIHSFAVQPVYYGHLNGPKRIMLSKCPDFPGHFDEVSFGTSTIGACIVQVSLFSSVHINRFHCSVYVLCIYMAMVAKYQSYIAVYVTGFGKTCIVHTSDFAHSKVHNTC